MNNVAPTQLSSRCRESQCLRCNLYVSCHCSPTALPVVSPQHKCVLTHTLIITCCCCCCCCSLLLLSLISTHLSVTHQLPLSCSSLCVSPPATALPSQFSRANPSQPVYTFSRDRCDHLLSDNYVVWLTVLADCAITASLLLLSVCLTDRRLTGWLTD